MDELYVTLRPGLRWMVCRSVGPQDTDDVVQEVFYAAFRMIQRGAVRDPAHLIAYVRGIARNHIRGRIRSVVAWREHETALEVARHWPAHEPSPEEVAGANESAAVAREALKRLPDRKR